MSLVSAIVRTGRRIGRRAPPHSKLVRLRALGRPHGVTWLRATMAANGVDRLSDLPRRKVDELIAGLERAAAEEVA